MVLSPRRRGRRDGTGDWELCLLFLEASHGVPTVDALQILVSELAEAEEQELLQSDDRRPRTVSPTQGFQFFLQVVVFRGRGKGLQGRFVPQRLRGESA